MTRGSAYFLVLGILLAPIAHASADECASDSLYCVSRPVSYAWQSPNGLNVMLDTGWVPSGSPLQVKIYLAATGYAAVTLQGDAGASWPAPIAVGFDADTGQGNLTVDYGFALSLRFRFHVRVLGQDIDWEGDIPIPGLPSDLRMYATRTLDSLVLPGATPRPVTVADATSDIRVLDANVLGSLIPIPGLSGGIALDARASLDARYSTERIAVNGALPPLVTSETGSVMRNADNGDYGAALDVPTRPTGTLQQVMSIVLTPTVYLDIFGVGFSFPVLSLPIDVIDTSTTVSFPAKTVHFPLADVTRVNDAAIGEIALGAVKETSVGFVNEGEGSLSLDVVSLPEGMTTTTSSLVLASGEAKPLVLAFTGSVPGDIDEEIVLATNDPDSPEIRVPVHGFVTTGEMQLDGGTDAEVADAGFIDGGIDPLEGTGCGCRVHARSSANGALGIALVLGLVLVRRRRSASRTI